MLTPAIHAAFGAGVAALEAIDLVAHAASGQASTEPNRCSGRLFQTTDAAFVADKTLGHEIFGAAAIIVRCSSLDAMISVIASLEGQLTATLQLDADDEATAAMLLPRLAGKVGRVLANGWPTGVEVTHAMGHGGPFPSTSDGRTTSVGTLAMVRFLRPVCYQDIPDALLPPPVQAGNPWRVPRRVDGQRETN